MKAAQAFVDLLAAIHRERVPKDDIIDHTTNEANDDSNQMSDLPTP